MTILAMPSGIGIRRFKFALQYNTQLFVSPLNQSEQRIELPGARWFANYELAPYRDDEAILAEIKSFLLRLRGAANGFYGYDPVRRTPKGVATGTPLVKGGSQTGSTLETDGWTAGVTGILLTGDYITVNNELKQITQDVNSDGSGNATLVFAPVLRDSPADNAPIITTNPTCIMRLVDDEQGAWDVDESGFHTISFSAVETFI